MADRLLDLHAAAFARLSTLEHIAAYDGVVPDKVEVDRQGLVTGYAVLWSSAGSTAEATATAAGPRGYDGGLDWWFQVTCVGGTQTRALQVAAKVRALFIGHQLIDAAGRLSEEPQSPGVLIDRDVKPWRFYVPLRWPLLSA